LTLFELRHLAKQEKAFFVPMSATARWSAQGERQVKLYVLPMAGLAVITQKIAITARFEMTAAPRRNLHPR
jgi:hypothetical protein